MPHFQTTTLSFNEITPFVRYVQHITLNPNVPPNPKMLYDHRITYICGGTGLIQIEEDSYPCNIGDLFFWGPSVRYAVHRSAEDPLTMINVHFDFTSSHKDKKFIPPAAFIQSFNDEMVTEKVAFTDMFFYNKPFCVRNYHHGESELLKIVEEYKLQKNFNSQLINGMFLSFLAYLSRYLTYKVDSNIYRHNTADLIIDYIHQNYDKPLTNKAIAETFSFHPNYLNRLLISYTGTSLYQYILSVKVNKAFEMLQTTALTITDIAQALGFCDISHFSKLFKEKTGYSPSELR